MRLTARVARFSPEISSTRRGTGFELWRADDGLFYTEGLVNGKPVRFLVDTGASMIVLTARDAQRVGATLESNATLRAETAGGNRAMSRATLANVEVGGTGAKAIPAAVAHEGLQISLLGQNWLSHLASVTIEGDRMLLR